MMTEPMSLEKAREIAHAVMIGRHKFGAQYNPPFPGYDIAEALVVLHLAGKDSVSKDDVETILNEAQESVTVANRRAGAAEARLARCLKKDAAEHH